MKDLSKPKNRFGRRFVGIFGMIVPMAIAMILVFPDSTPEKGPAVWRIQINGLGPEIELLEVYDVREPDTRTRCIKSKNTQSVEVQILLPVIVSGKFPFKTVKPDLSPITVGSRDSTQIEQLHTLVVTSSSRGVAEVKLGPPPPQAVPSLDGLPPAAAPPAIKEVPTKNEPPAKADPPSTEGPPPAGTNE